MSGWSLSSSSEEHKGSLSSVNQGTPSQSISEEQQSVKVRTLGEQVCDGVVYGPQPRPEPIPRERMGDSEQPFSDESESEFCVATVSRARPVHVKYNLRPNLRLWKYARHCYLRAFKKYSIPIAQYQAYIDYMDILYWDQVPLLLEYADWIWIRTIMYFFPDTAFWARKKNDIVERGPNDHFVEFRDHMNQYIVDYMYIE